jgi:hypothetical protein
VLEFCKKRSMLLGKPGTRRPLCIQPFGGAHHRVDHRDVHADDENIESECNGGVVVHLERTEWRYEPVPGSKAREHGAHETGTRPRKERGEDNGREEGEIGKARREFALQ